MPSLQMRQISKRFPGAELHVDYLRPERVYEAVLAEQADLGLVSYPEPGRQIRVIDWRSEEMVVAVAPSPLVSFGSAPPCISVRTAAS